MQHQKFSHSWALGKGSLMPQEEVLETGRKRKQLAIGIPKETQEDESRTALTPEAVEILTGNGHQVLIEKGAAAAANYSDTDYSERGGFIVEERAGIFSRCDVILKVAPPVNDEIEQMKGGQVLISSLRHMMQERDYFQRLMKKKVTAIAFEYLRNNDDTFPVIRSMSEIAGGASILIAAEYLSNQNKGKGVMLGGITGITPTEVVILGAGTAAESAARAATGLGAFVKVFDHSVDRLRRLQDILGQRLYTSIYHPRVVAKALRSADVVIGAIHLGTEGPRFFITGEMVSEMKKGAVIVDLSIDQGGCIETSECRTHKSPVFVKHGVIHYCVPNIPSRVARTATIALSNIFAPLLLSIGESGGIKQSLLESPGLRKGVYIYNGLLTNSLIGNLFDIPSKDIDLLMAAF
ncbi:MAG: alanine dehydrogenase [Marinilabiliales bacterium]|nr:MAG: alanine dehydrogenase [Marinilabiliales bacterium]